MVTLRWANATALADHRLRWGNAVASGAAGAPKFRWAQGSLVGTATPTLRPIPDRLVEALTTVTISALLGATSPTPTGYSWRQVSGPDTPFSDGGDTIMFTAPATIPGAAVVFGVTATLAGQQSSESTATVDVVPHLYWLAGSDGWQPLTRTAVA